MLPDLGQVVNDVLYPFLNNPELYNEKLFTNSIDKST